MPRRRDATRLGGSRTPRTNPHAAARRELSARHPRLARLCELAHPIERVVPDKRPLSHLIVRTIVGQLVSTAAARSIMTTLLEAHGDIDGIIAWAMRDAGRRAAIALPCRAPSERRSRTGDCFSRRAAIRASNGGTLGGRTDRADHGVCVAWGGGVRT